MGRTSYREIMERREKILFLKAKGKNDTEIANELGVKRLTVNRDMHYINKMTNKGLFDQAKSTIPTLYINCLDGLNEILRKCWGIIDNEDDDRRINQWVKLAAMRLAGDTIEKKFNMIQWPISNEPRKIAR